LGKDKAMDSFKESYDKKIENSEDFTTNIQTYIRRHTNSGDTLSFVYYLSSMFEPIVLHGYKVTGITKSTAVCEWLDKSTGFKNKKIARALFQKLRVARNSIVHLNINYNDDYNALRDYVSELDYPIFKQCMEDLLQDFKSLYDMEDIYVKLGGNEDTLPKNDLEFKPEYL